MFLTFKETKQLVIVSKNTHFSIHFLWFYQKTNQLENICVGDRQSATNE